MRKLSMLLMLACMYTLQAFAQDSYKAEIFGGYQYTRVNPGSGLDGENFNGWNASVTGDFNSWLGLTADFSGGYKSVGGVDLKVHNFLFGPTISSNRSEKFKPFAHALFGVSHASGEVGFVVPVSGGPFTASASDNAFAMALGGGVDVAFHRNFALRLIQADYLMTRFGGETQNNARISTGIVFRF